MSEILKKEVHKNVNNGYLSVMVLYNIFYLKKYIWYAI